MIKWKLFQQYMINLLIQILNLHQNIILQSHIILSIYLIFKIILFKDIRSPQFYDEIKIQLPLNITEGHHILFTFVHVSCKSGKSLQTIETPIGYSVCFLVFLIKNL